MVEMILRNELVILRLTITFPLDNIIMKIVEVNFVRKQFNDGLRAFCKIKLSKFNSFARITFKR